MGRMIVRDIDWKRFSEINGLTPKQFEQEIMLVAIALLQMRARNGDAIARITASGYETTMITKAVPDE